MVAPVAPIDPDYQLTLTPEDLDRLGLGQVTPHEVVSLALLCAPEDGPLTANLLAPIVINIRTRVAVQAVRTDRRYSHQHPIQKLSIKGDATC